MFFLELEPSSSMKTFSPRERWVFFENLGYVPFFLFIPLWIVGFFVNILVDSDALGGLIIASLVIIIVFCSVKFLGDVGPIKSSKREAKGCEFHKYKREKDGAICGSITYNNITYDVEYFDLTKEGDDLLYLSVKIFEDEKSGKDVRIYYDKHEKKFVEVTEVRDEVYKSYEIISWVFFVSSLLADLALLIAIILV